MLPQANMLAKENFIRLNPFWGGGGASKAWNIVIAFLDLSNNVKFLKI